MQSISKTHGSSRTDIIQMSIAVGPGYAAICGKVKSRTVGAIDKLDCLVVCTIGGELMRVKVLVTKYFFLGYFY